MPRDRRVSNRALIGLLVELRVTCDRSVVELGETYDLSGLDTGGSVTGLCWS